MRDSAVETLKALTKETTVVWLDGTDQAKIVQSVGRRAEEDELAEDGNGGPCVIFTDGTYACLENCELSEFATIQRLG